MQRNTDSRMLVWQDYLGVIDPDAPIVMKPEIYLSDDDISANSLHVLDCMF